LPIRQQRSEAAMKPSARPFPFRRTNPARSRVIAGAGAVALVLCCITIPAADAATHVVQVISFRFEPEELTIQPGDTVVWRNTGGNHNVVADDSSFGSGRPSAGAWEYSYRFEDPGEFGYYCSPHGGRDGEGMSGKVLVAGSAAPSFAIGPGISGTWNSPGIPGQGFLLEVVPALDSLVLGWFTWSAATPGAHDWISAIGPIDGDSAAVDLQRSGGGRFNDPTAVTASSVGSATFRFTDCSTGSVSFTRSDIGQSGTIPIRRLTPVPANCTPPAANRAR
jgi:plastocyanin